MLFTLAISLKTKLVVIQKVYFLLSFTYETFNSFRISSTITFAVRTSPDLRQSLARMSDDSAKTVSAKGAYPIRQNCRIVT
jgi:hypothetical protein